MKLTKTQAIQSALTGDWAQSIILNNQLLEENPKDVEALNRIGLAYMILGKTKEAKATYEKVIEIDPLNSIALKNLKKIKTEKPTGEQELIMVNNTFLEETGRTKVVELVNLAPTDVLTSLRTGQSLELSVKRLKVFISQGKKYVGALPDDIGMRLIKFMAGGNKYEAFVKSANPHEVSVFIRELKRVTKFKDQPSFLSVIEKKTVRRGKRTKLEDHQDDEEEEAPSEE